MDWQQAVDIYCERTSPAFWAEPLNAASNVAFPMAALWAAITARKRGITDPVIWLLIALAASIGLGSFLFHTFANRWSEYADTIPIWSFVALFVFVAVHRIGGVKPGRLLAMALAVAAVVTIAFLATGEGTPAHTAPEPLNGSGQYAPAMLALFAFAAISQWRGHPMRHWIAAAALVFLLSLTFRTYDIALCQQLPIGTHFIWHLLNATMIGILLQVLVRMPRPSNV
jgi:Ceramidase